VVYSADDPRERQPGPPIGRHDGVGKGARNRFSGGPKKCPAAAPKTLKNSC